jgi:hypothetical protein
MTSSSRLIRAKQPYDVLVVAHSEELVRTRALFDERVSHKACCIQAIAYRAVAWELARGYLYARVHMLQPTHTTAVDTLE